MKYPILPVKQCWLRLLWTITITIWTAHDEVNSGGDYTNNDSRSDSNGQLFITHPPHLHMDLPHCLMKPSSFSHFWLTLCVLLFNICYLLYSPRSYHSLEKLLINLFRRNLLVLSMKISLICKIFPQAIISIKWVREMFKFPHYRLVEGSGFEIMSIMAKINVTAQFLRLENVSQPLSLFFFNQQIIKV